MSDVRLENRGRPGNRGSTGPTGPTGPAGSGSRTIEISPWSGGSDVLPAAGNSAGPQLQAGQFWWVPVEVDAGEQVTSLAFRVFGDGAVDVSWGLFLFDYATNTNTPIASGVVTNAPASWTLVNSGMATTPVALGQALVFAFNPNAGGSFAGLITANVEPQP